MTDPHRSTERCHDRERPRLTRRRHPSRSAALGYGCVVLCSAVLGAVGVLPFVTAPYAVSELVLAPLGLAAADPTNDDGAAVVVIAGIAAPAAVAAAWAGLTAVLVRRHRLSAVASWVLAVAILIAPTSIFVTGTTG